jgi:hypothetical protein
MRAMQPRLVILILGMALAFPPPAWGHALKAECSLKNGTIRVEAFFSNDSPAIDAKVEVLDSAGKNVVASGKTDAEGNWTCAAPAAGAYLVVVDAGMGHRAHEPITVPHSAMASPSPFDPSPSTESGTIISDGPNRSQFTRFPYLKVSLGLGAIFLFSFAFLAARKMARAESKAD